MYVTVSGVPHDFPAIERGFTVKLIVVTWNGTDVGVGVGVVPGVAVAVGIGVGVGVTPGVGVVAGVLLFLCPRTKNKPPSSNNNNTTATTRPIIRLIFSPCVVSDSGG